MLNRSQKIIDNRFVLRCLVGTGSFGDVYLAKDMVTSQKVALKIECTEQRFTQITNEARLLKKLDNSRGVPQLIRYGTDSKANC